MSDESEMKFAIGHDGTIEVDGQVVETPEQPDILDELPPAEAAPPEAPEVSRLRAELEELSAFRPMLERLGRGEITIQEAAPPEPVPPAPEEMAQYFARVQSPHGAAIHERVKAYAEFLPESQRAELDSIPSRYNEVFDKLAGVDHPAPQRGPGREAIERILAAKESRKDSARSERAGVLPETPAGDPLRWKQIDTVKRRIRGGDNSTATAAKLAQLMGLGD